MAERRMFAKQITDSDMFTELPPTTQALYFHLCMSADDDGFTNKIRQAMFNAHADRNDFNLLITNRFIIPFDDSGIIVIKHWHIHNLIRKDRYHETKYIEEKAALLIKENGAYTESDNQVATNGLPSDNQVTTTRQPSDNQRLTEVSIGKDSIGKDSIGECIAAEPPRASDNSLSDNTEKTGKTVKHKYGIFNHVLLTDDEMSKLVAEYGLVETQQAIKYLDEYIEMKGVKYKSHYLALKKWVYDAVKEQKQRSQKIQPAKLNSFNNVSSLQHESPQFDTIAELIESGAFD